MGVPGYLTKNAFFYAGSGFAASHICNYLLRQTNPNMEPTSNALTVGLATGCALGASAVFTHELIRNSWRKKDWPKIGSNIAKYGIAVVGACAIAIVAGYYFEPTFNEFINSSLSSHFVPYNPLGKISASVGAGTADSYIITRVGTDIFKWLRKDGKK